MYCNNCGKFLAGSENFCSNCGEKVVKEPAVVKETVETTEKESIKIISPVDDFTWDLKEFPSNKPKKTEDAEFNWNSGDMFLHKEIVRENSMKGTVTDNSQVQEQISNSFCFRGNSIEQERERKAKEEAERREIEEKKKKNTASNLEIPSVFKYRLGKMEEKESYNVEVDMPDFLKDEMEKNTVTRNTKPYDADQFESDFVVEIEQPKAGGITVEVGEEKTPSLTSMLDKIQENEDAEVDMSVESKMSFVVEEQEEAPAVVEEAKVEQSSLIDEIADEVQAALDIPDENLAEENKKIDKFYTFNKKKEEFQKLLDREYERMEGKVEKGGLEDDISGFMDVSTGKEVEATSQIEEMIKARAMFFEDPIAREYVDSLENDEKEALDAEEKAVNEYSIDESLINDEPAFEPVEEEKTENSEPETVAEAIGDERLVEALEETMEETETEVEEEPVTEVVFEPVNEESLAEVLLEKEASETEENEENVALEEVAEEENEAKEEEPVEEEEGQSEDAAEEKTVAEAVVDSTGIATVIIDPVQEKRNMTEKLAEEFFDDEEEEEKSSGKGLVFVLIVLIFLVAGLLCTRVFMPETVISKYIDTFAEKAVTLIEKVIPGETESEEQRDSLIEDKTALIELQKDKNFNNNIESIVYDKNAKYSDKKEYDIKDLTGAKDIQTNFWYEEKGKNYYYDEAMVGLVIAFESERAAYVNSGDKQVFQQVEKDSPIAKSLEKETETDKKITFKKLGIGDIKVAGDSYYIWVSESINDSTKTKVYRAKEIDRTLVIVDVCAG